MPLQGQIRRQDLTAVFTEAYLDVIQELIKVESPGLAVFGDKSDLVTWGKGHRANFPTRQMAKRGIVGGSTGRIPRGGRPTFDMAQFRAKIFRLGIQYDWDALYEATNEKYIANLVKQAMTDVKQQWLRRMNTHMYCNSGILARLHTTADAAATEIRVVMNVPDGAAYNLATGTQALTTHLNEHGRPGTNLTAAAACVSFGGMYLQVGDFICIGEMSNTGANNVVGKSEIRQITAIDRSAYTAAEGSRFATITVDSALSTDYPANRSVITWASPAQADINLAMANADVTQIEDTDFASDHDGTRGDASSCLPGFEDVINPSFSHTTFDDYLGIETDSLWGSEVSTAGDEAGGTAGTPRALNFDRIEAHLMNLNARRYRRPNVMFMNPGLWLEWCQTTKGGGGDAATPGHSYSTTNASSLTGGPGTPATNQVYSSVNVVTGVGSMNVIIDPYCPPQTIYAVNTGDCGYMTRVPLGIANDDGSDFRFSNSGYDDLEAFMRTVKTFVAMHPAAISKICDIDQTSVAL